MPDAFADYIHTWRRWQQKKSQSFRNSGDVSASKSVSNSSFPFRCHECGVVGYKRYQCLKNKQKSFQRRQVNTADEERQEVTMTFFTI